ncbi:hypothetical protein [Xanthomonas sp. NCPPB 2632]|uniref:hypothetical protein n=1 Tax=Xanthomonas sp. NCPPB 2632 TaxID=3240912 RepID=UPI003518472D
MMLIFLTLVFILAFSLEWATHRARSFDRKIENLDKAIRDLEQRLPGSARSLVSGDGDAAIEKRRGFVVFYIALIFAATGSAIYIYAKYSADVRHDVSEFVSYVLPCFAGIAGGLGLYYRDSKLAEVWFWSSGILIGAGIVAFVISKADSGLVGMWTAAFVVFVMSVTLLNVGIHKRGRFFPTSGPQWGWFLAALFFTLVSGPLLGLGYVYEDIIKYPNDWESRGILQKVTFRAVAYIEQIRRS